MTLPQPEADELLPIEQAMRAFYDGWPSFKAWWESIDNSYGGKMSFDDLPPEPFEAALAKAWNRRAPTPAPDHEAEIAALSKLAERYLQQVCDWDDRTSPEDWPEALLITGDELIDLLKRFHSDAVAIMRWAALPQVRSRDELGRIVREAWVRWAKTQSNPKPSWLVPYDELNESDKEVDRQIGEAVTWAALPIAEEDRKLVRNILVVTAAKTEAAREKATLPDAREWLASHAQRLREIAAKLEGRK